MPADHGTPNTGDERDREVEAAARAIHGVEAEHSWLVGEGRIGAWDFASDDLKDLRRNQARAALGHCPSRDGTVAVEDVVERLREAAAFEYAQDHHSAGDTFTIVANFVEAEFGVSERTERIHDQATKEKDQR